MDHHLLTVDEVARLARLSPEAIRRNLRAGKLPALKIAGRWRIDARVVTPPAAVAAN